MFLATFGGPVGRSWQWVVVGLVLALAIGCVTNHPFVRGAELDVPSLVSELEKESQEDDALFDVTYIPLAHLDLQVFAENDDTERYPKGHAFISMRSWLPLFGIVDGDVELYDAEQSPYEKKEFTSVLWGLWSRERTTVQTDHGARTERNYSLLWILDWGRRVHYELSSDG